MILVTGANGVVGQPLVLRLIEQDRTFLSVSRHAKPDKHTLVWDLEHSPDPDIKQRLASVDTLIHCAPIWLLVDQLPVLAESRLQRLVVFSSSSVTSKVDSSSPEEQQLVSQLRTAEEAIKQFCATHHWDLTILRPSMIYGYGLDQNVMHLARFIHRRGFMVLVGAAKGERQPVHADDLVDAGLSILGNPQTYQKTYTLAGQETLSYRAMVLRLFEALGKPARLVKIPLWVFRLMLSVAAKFGRFAYTPDMADRMNQNLSYDISPAVADFAYSPQRFLENPKRDLGDLI